MTKHHSISVQRDAILNGIYIRDFPYHEGEACLVAARSQTTAHTLTLDHRSARAVLLAIKEIDFNGLKRFLRKTREVRPLADFPLVRKDPWEVAGCWNDHTTTPFSPIDVLTRAEILLKEQTDHDHTQPDDPRG